MAYWPVLIKGVGELTNVTNDVGELVVGEAIGHQHMNKANRLIRNRPN